MCGIAGWFTRRDRAYELDRISEALAHRGPDDVGTEAISDASGEPAGGFAHRRLSILDLSQAGHQPMRTADGRFTVTYNGEIYNFRELRAELAQLGIPFQTENDTEVLLLGWAALGPKILHLLRGMYAFAVWDREASEGWLVRDPFGIKPLYVAEIDGGVVFASELRALLASERIPRRLSQDGLAAYLSAGSVTEPLTIVEGVRMVLAGTALPVRLQDGAFRLGHPLQYSREVRGEGRPLERDRKAAAARLRAVLRESVAQHLLSDVPVGFFLSGGIDSSAIVGLASESLAVPPETFTVTFAEAQFNEAAPAAAVAARFGTRHHEIPLSGEDLLAALPDAFEAMDQPSLDGVNTFVVSKAVRDWGIKVALSGLGGDEFFAGYPSFRRARAISPLWRLPRGVRRAGSVAASSWPGGKGAKLGQLIGGETPALASYRASRSLFGELRIARLMGGAGVARIESNPPGWLSVLQQVSWLEATGYMRNTLLRDSDVFSMAHGLELRVPMVDLKVAAIAGQSDDDLKLARGVSKPLLLSAVEDLLPREVWDRPKRGFTLPFAVFLRGALRTTVRDGLRPERLARVGLHPDEAGRVWDAFEAGRITWSRPWAIYTLVRWAELNDVSVSDFVSRPTFAESPISAVA